MREKQMPPLQKFLEGSDQQHADVEYQKAHIEFYAEIIKRFPWARYNSQVKTLKPTENVCFVLRDLSYGGVHESEVIVLCKEGKTLRHEMDIKDDLVQMRWLNTFSNGLLFLADRDATKVTLWDLKIREMFLDTKMCSELRIGYNHLTALRLSRCENVRLLDCRGNYFLENLNVSKAPQLEELYCENCGIGVLDASNCAKLARVDCRDCEKLKTLDLNGTPRLEFLCINRCSNLTIAKVIDSTMLEEISLKGCASLTPDKVFASESCTVK